MDMAGEVAASPAPIDPLRELADRLLEAYRDQAAEWNAFASEVLDHIRDIFEAAIGGFQQAMPSGDTEVISAGETG